MLSEILDDLDSDAYYNGLTDEEKFVLIQKLRKQKTNKDFVSSAGSIKEHFHGEIKRCPKCEKIRITGCSACGCGSCYTCNYRWVCMPYEHQEINIKVDFSKVKYYDNQSLTVWKPEVYNVN